MEKTKTKAPYCFHFSFPIHSEHDSVMLTRKKSSLWLLTLSILVFEIHVLERVPICSHFETYLKSLNSQIKMV